MTPVDYELVDVGARGIEKEISPLVETDVETSILVHSEIKREGIVLKIIYIDPSKGR